MKLPKRKPTRLKDYDYNNAGYYFITVCTKDKQKILCDIVGTGVLDGPQIKFTEYGKNIWQYRSYDHIICGEQDYKEIWQYIDTNLVKWKEDKFYTE